MYGLKMHLTGSTCLPVDTLTTQKAINGFSCNFILGIFTEASQNFPIL
jgi:hypothetical protein